MMLSAATFVIHDIVALLFVIFVAAMVEIIGGEALAQLVPLGVMVYTVEPVVSERAAVTRPLVQVSVTELPLLLVAMARSDAGDSNVNASPPESETMTLVALRVTRSATEFVAMVNVVAGDVTKRPTGEVKVTEAAWASNATKNPMNRIPIESQ
jgi:hypothetical protein